MIVTMNDSQLLIYYSVTNDNKQQWPVHPTMQQYTPLVAQ